MQSIEWRNGHLRFLDQTRLPAEERYVDTEDPAEVVEAIKALAIRGAPLIGIAAAYALVLAAKPRPGTSRAEDVRAVERWADALMLARPTAVNLRWAINRMKSVVSRWQAGSAQDLEEELVAEARAIHREDADMCDVIARQGAGLLKKGSRVVTHCNTGALATGGEGTALGIIKRGWDEGRVTLVYVDETRPLLQGARLTAWELGKAGIPFRLITDSTAAYLMQQGRVDAVVVGADRIARNGDVANKIGTYSLATAAAHHAIPFIVAAPSSTFDVTTRRGAGIPIEERSGTEIVEWGGRRIAPEGAETYAPAFDITPASMVSMIVTERGVLTPPLEAAIGRMAGTGKM